MTRQGKYQRDAESESVWIYEPFCIRHRGRSDQRNFPQSRVIGNFASVPIAAITYRGSAPVKLTTTRS